MNSNIDNKPEYQYTLRNSANLTANEISLLKKAVSSHVFLNPNKTYEMSDIKKLEPNKFSLIIDHKIKIFISTNDDQVNINVIREKVDSKSFFVFKFFKDIWKGVLTLFYTPNFAPLQKERSSKQAISQDFRQLRKGIESVKNWLEPKEYQVIVEKNDKNQVLLSETKGCIDKAKQIEKALDSKNQPESFEKLAQSFANEILVSNKDTAVIIPVGYLNADMTLQPVMLRFYKNEDNSTSLEIYSDATDGAEKIAPSQYRKFNGNQTAEDIETVLKTAFKPLHDKKDDVELLLKATVPSQTFSQVLDAKAKQLGVVIPKEQKERKLESNPHSLTFEGMMRSLDKAMLEDKKLWEDVAQPDQKMIKSPGTPVERVSKWFSDMAQKSGRPLNGNEKINFLLDLSKNYVKDQLFQIKDKNEKDQLEIYENCLAHIDHMINKTSRAFNGNQPIEDAIIPGFLKEKRAECIENIYRLSQADLKERRILEEMKLSKPQDYALDLKIELPYSTKIKEVQVQVEGGKPLNLLEMQTNWEVMHTQFAEFTSKNSIQLKQKQAIYVNLTKVFGEEVVNELFNNDEIDVDFLLDLLEDAVDDFDPYMLKTIGKDQLVSVFFDLILCPYLLPVSSLNTEIIMGLVKQIECSENSTEYTKM